MAPKHKYYWVLRDSSEGAATMFWQKNLSWPNPMAPYKSNRELKRFATRKKAHAFLEWHKIHGRDVSFAVPTLKAFKQGKK